MASTPETRQFRVDTPLIRISDATTNAVVRTIYFDPSNNEPNLSVYDWDPHSQTAGAVTEVDNGDLYTHYNGVRMRCVLTFGYWHPGYTVNAPQNQSMGFNEHDYAWLKIAQVGTAYNIEFFPFGGQGGGLGTPPNEYYHCDIVSLTRQQEDGSAWRWACTLEVRGINVVTEAPVQ